MKPILFSTPMVQAILAGQKTMTRRVITPPKWSYGTFVDYETFDNGQTIDTICAKTGCFARIEPKYAPGDVLWVRETWQYAYSLDNNDQIIEGTGRYLYAATDTPPFGLWVREDGTHAENMPWRPSIFMPRAAARIFLRVTRVRAERLQEITPYDAWCEGCRIGTSISWEEHIPELQQMCRDIAFQQLWDHLNDARGYGWATNPWVWVYEYERISKEEAER